MSSAWKENHYGTQNLRLEEHIGGYVAWHTDRNDKYYVAYWMGEKLGSFDTVNEAKQAVETRARKALNTALKNLGDE